MGDGRAAASKWALSCLPRVTVAMKRATLCHQKNRIKLCRRLRHLNTPNPAFIAYAGKHREIEMEHFSASSNIVGAHRPEASNQLRPLCGYVAVAITRQPARPGVVDVRRLAGALHRVT